MTTTAPVKKKPVRAFDVILISVLGVLALITVYPFYNVLILSFSNIAAQAKHTPYMWFWALDLEGYKTIVGDVYFFLSLGNTLFVTIVGTSINLLLFAPMMLITGGGPSGTTNVLMYEAYKQAFKYGNYDKGSAITSILVVLILVVVFLQFRLMDEKD